MFERIWKFVAWFTLLFIGLFLIHVFTTPMSISGSGAGTGIFAYLFQAHFLLDNQLANGHSILGSINIEGRSESRFQLWGQMSPRYNELQMDWLIYGEKRSEGQAVIDLEQMVLQQDGRKVPLTHDSISRLIDVTNSSGGSNPVVNGLMDFFLAAHDGTLPSPRHHSHSLPGPLSGRISHFAHGPMIRPLEFIWIIAWVIYGLAKLFLRRSKLAA